MKISVAIVDDHQIVIEGLKLFLRNLSDIEVVAEDTSGLMMLQKLANLHVDVLLTDIMMPEMDGMAVATYVKQHHPHIKIIALSMNAEGELVDKLINHIGVDAYLLKTVSKQELVEAIRSVANNTSYYSTEILDSLDAYTKQVAVGSAYLLTQREHEIIKHISLDKSNKQIAEILFISERTVETHRKNIFRKLDVHSVIGLVDLARKHKWVD